MKKVFAEKKGKGPTVWSADKKFERKVKAKEQSWKMTLATKDKGLTMA